MDWSQWVALVFTGLYTVAASAGSLEVLPQRQSEKQSEIQLLLGLSREPFHIIGASYIERGGLQRRIRESGDLHIYAPTRCSVGTAQLTESWKRLATYCSDRPSTH